MDKNKTIIITRSSGVSPDARVEKLASLLIDNYKIKVLCWDRVKKFQKNEERGGYIIYRSQINGYYGKGKKNIFPLIKWWVYEFFWLLKTPFDIVLACDFDTYLPALFAAKLKRRKVIYDMVDFYGDMIPVAIFLKKIIKKIDIFLMRFADGIILVDDNRKSQIVGARPKRLLAIYNSPLDLYSKFKDNIENSWQSNTFTAGYIGIIGKERGFESFVKVFSSMPEINLILGGFSHNESEKEIIEKIKNIPNIKFIGLVSPYEKIPENLSRCDVILALYDPSLETNKYSSPNKMFEAMMLSKPIIASRNTTMDKIIEENKCGIIVDFGNLEQIKNAILELADRKRRKDNFYGENGRKAYMNVFHNDIMKERLLNLCNDIFK